MHHVTITTKTIAVQILILEDAADTEDKAYRTKSVCENPYDTSKYLVL